MTLGEFRKQFKDLPDSTILVRDSGDHSYRETYPSRADTHLDESGDYTEYSSEDLEDEYGKKVMVILVE